MKAIWYIKIKDRKEGPFTAVQLRHHPDVTPDTLVWRKGFADWIPIRCVAELQDIFQDIPEEETPYIKPKFKTPFENDELALDYRQDPYSLLWLLLVLLVIVYVIYRVYHL